MALCVRPFASPPRLRRVCSALSSAVLALALTTSATATAARGSIHGRVLDPQGRAVPGARVALQGAGSAGNREVTADATGAFSVLELPAGRYRLEATAQGFATRTYDPFGVGGHRSLEAIAEVFNLFNITNVLGVSTRNYSGYSNVLARDSQDPASPGYLTSSSFGQAVTTAGGVFGSGGPRAFQLGLRLRY